MKTVLFLFILLFGHISFSEEKKNSQKFLETMAGKWEFTVSGNMSVGENEPDKMHVKHQSEAKLYFDSRLIIEKYFIKGSNFGGAALEGENLDFFLYDSESKSLLAVQASSIYGIHTQAYKLDSPSRITAIIKKKPGENTACYYEFLKNGNERTGVFLAEHSDFKMFMTINWLGVKVKDFEKKIKIKEVFNENPKLKAFKGENHKWVLGGSALFGEFKEGENHYFELIGEMVTKTHIRKYQFHADASVKAFKPEQKEGKTVWEKTDSLYELPRP